MAPTPVRDAATVMVVRDAADGEGIEVLMLQRHRAATFAGGAHVFPGGAVDPADRELDVARWCRGRTDEEASARLGIASGGLAFFVAAVRECFEEAGLLLGGSAPPAHLAAHRRSLNAGTTTMAALCQAELLQLSVDRMEYFSHWITPLGAPRRFDTRFFVAEAPADQTAVHDEGETIASRWIAPAEALQLHDDGTFDLLLPTLENLAALGRFERAADLLDAARRANTVPAMLPRVRVDEIGVRIFLPGDPGYDEASEEAGLLEGMPLPGRPGGPLPRKHFVTDELVPGAVVEVAPAVRRIVAPNPSVMTGPGTNTYLVGAGDVAVVDPGPADDGHLDAIAAAGAGRIRHVLVTHTHPDHAPGAAGLAARTGATVLGFDARDGFVPDGQLGEGDTVAGDGFRLVAMHTPGHASNHLCYLEPAQGLLFSGDHVMGGSTVVIAPPDGDMSEYLTSLERLLGLDPPLRAIAPGHGSLLTDPQQVLKGYVAHRLAREAAIAGALGLRREATVDELVADVYVDVPEALHPIARYSVWAHLRRLAAAGTAAGPGSEELAGRWRAT